MAPPLVQAAAGGGRGILRIKRKQHDCLAASPVQGSNRLRRKGMPITHRHQTACIHALGLQALLQRRRLLLGEPADGRASANHCIVMVHLLGPRDRDQLSQRLAPQLGKRKINNVRIAKQVEQKRFDRLQRFRPAQLK